MVMIGIHEDGFDNILGFRILDTDSSSVKDVGYNDVKNVLSSGTHQIENLKLENGKVVGANGSLSRFPKIVNGGLVGVSPLIVLEELVNDFYRVTNYVGEIVDIDEKKVIEYSDNYAIANGKIVTDSESGKKYLSSINGTYKKNRLIKDKKSADKLTAKLKLLGDSSYNVDADGFAYKNNDKLEELILGKGVIGIKESGFERMSFLKKVSLPSTLETLSPASFCLCASLEYIEIPEGVTVIPSLCFSMCKSLTRVILPNSLKEIHTGAFSGCDKLSVIQTGPEPINVSFGAVPTGVKWIRREVEISKAGVETHAKPEVEVIMVACDAGGTVYRLFDIKAKDKKIMTVPDMLLSKALMDKKIAVSNLSADSQGVVITNGSLPSYAVLDKAGRLTKDPETSPFTVINVIGNKGYTIVRPDGRVLKISTSDAVRLAKHVGVTNGRIVSVSGVEVLQSLGEQYEVIEIAKSKVGDNVDDVGVNISISNRDKSLKGGTNVDVKIAINDNDVFSVMIAEQKNVLKSYYVQYTLDLYTEMAKNIRLELAPGKADKLAQLRGEQDWEFAGVWDTGFVGASHCALGHPLRYEYYAVPSSEGEKRRKRRLSKQHYEDLVNDSAKIVFGESCAADFFSISKEDMDTLVKTRKAMSEEIKLMSDILTNNLEKEYEDRLELMYSIIDKLDTDDRIQKAFGNYLGNTLIRFMKNGMPFPKTLVLECSKFISKEPEEFYRVLFPEYGDLLSRIYTNEETTLYEGTKLCLNFILENRIEGDYAYNPLNENTRNERRDVGGYNKATRYARRELLGAIRQTAMVNKFELEELEYLFKTTMLLEKFSDSLYSAVKTSDILNKEEESLAKLAYRYVKDVMEEDINGELSYRLAVLNSIVFANKVKREDRIPVYTYFSYSKMRSRYCNTPYFSSSRISGLNRHRNSELAFKELDKADKYGIQQIIKDFELFVKEEVEIREKQERIDAETEIQLKEEEKRQLKLRLEKMEEKKRIEEEALRKSDKLYKLKCLMDKHSEFTESTSEYGVKVAKDIIKRGISFDKLSQKQQWRINEEIRRYEKLDAGVKGKETIKDNDENNRYNLDEYPEIKEKVERIQSKADSVEMVDVLKEAPNVLKICISIIKNKRATDKQLKHVNKAIEILDRA